MSTKTVLAIEVPEHSGIKKFCVFTYDDKGKYVGTLPHRVIDPIASGEQDTKTKLLKELYEEHERRIHLKRNDDDYLPIDDTQLGIEFAHEFIMRKLSDAKPPVVQPIGWVLKYPDGSIRSSTFTLDSEMDEERKTCGTYLPLYTV